MNNLDKAQEQHDLDKQIKYYPDDITECQDCGCELTDTEIKRETSLCSECDDECYCKQCTGSR